MKSIFVLIFSLLIIGCSEHETLIAPDYNDNSNLQKLTSPIYLKNNEIREVPIHNKNKFVDNFSENEPNWIKLPDKVHLGKTAYDESGYTITKFVPTNKDTELIIDENYKGGIHGEVKIIVKLKFYKGTVKEDNYVTMNVNDKNGTVTFGPSQVFNKDAELYVKFEGIDLTNSIRDEIDFVFIGKNGIIEKIKYKEIIFDRDSGTLELKEGGVPHFSRYGWTRRK